MSQMIAGCRTVMLVKARSCHFPRALLTVISFRAGLCRTSFETLSHFTTSDTSLSSSIAGSTCCLRPVPGATTVDVGKYHGIISCFCVQVRKGELHKMPVACLEMRAIAGNY